MVKRGYHHLIIFSTINWLENSFVVEDAQIVNQANYM